MNQASLSMSSSACQSERVDRPAPGKVAPERVTVLVVDDSPFDRHLVERLLSPFDDLKVVYAGSVGEGLEAVARESPAIVLTDLVLPDMEGLELVQRVRAEHPRIFVILMTAYGSEDVAMRALRAGAANYIAKKDVARDLVPTIRHILELAAASRERGRLLRCMIRRESVFVLENDPDLLSSLMKLLGEDLAGMGFWDRTGVLQVTIALQEALVNAMLHGNLEVGTEHRQVDERIFDDLALERRHSEPFCSRRIRVHVQLDLNAARFVVSDDGRGFDTTLFNRPVDAEDLSRIGGRGLILIRTFMDEVGFNSSGSQISMIKYRAAGSP
jgi:CheY-like chemotaxis protein/anti-sigma regulatory factor (Ser/Thr protein kinase)